MLALLSISSLLVFFFQLYSVQKYFAINMELFSKASLSAAASSPFVSRLCCRPLSLVFQAVLKIHTPRFTV